MTKKALITGITGQDGSYLAKNLLQKGYTVYGAKRRCSSHNDWRHEALGISNDICFVEFELLEASSIDHAIRKIQPNEIYHLAAQSFVQTSFQQPLYTADVDALGTLRILESIRHINPDIRFYQASSSEMFGKIQTIPQNEDTPFYPRSPYATSKLFSHWSTVNYRESYGMYCSSGILFNHESPLRGIEFVTRKITHCLAKIKHGKISHFELGNLEAKRDWGFAGDYVEGIYKMIQQPKPKDYVLATGETHSVKEFVELAAALSGFDLAWEGSDMNLRAIDKKTNKTILSINPLYYRPNEVDLLIGDASKAHKEIGWKPATSFEQLVEMMMRYDLDLATSAHHPLLIE